jgi:excisionase family DNA binding protein
LKEKVTMDSDLLAIEEAAKFLHIKPATVRAWILARKIPYVKLGGRVFLRKSDLEALINASVVPAKAEQGVRADGR